MPNTNYDIFISFKDRDNDSNRTVASRLAEDIYDTLDIKGYSVFYSRFVLPGMVGGQYEPVINHALETAKLLVLVFTNSDEVNSEWVKHEWKYFSKHDKHILTVFKDCGNARLENLPYVIMQLQYCDLTEGSKRQYEFMLKRIDEIMSGKLPTIAPELPRVEEKKPVIQKNKQTESSTPPLRQEEKQPQNLPNRPTSTNQSASKPTKPKIEVTVGQKVTFGQYPQGANGEVEPLVWRVLAVENGMALLITDKLIDAIPYNKEYTKVTWETCTLRKWMNNDFISKAFGFNQQARIATVTNQNPNNPEYKTKGGHATQDRIFALSIDEAKKYFRDYDDRMAAPTGYAKKQGCYVSDDYSLSTGEKTGWWWLRSPGSDSSCAADVLSNGDIYRDGVDVNYGYGCVRPAFWLNL